MPGVFDVYTLWKTYYCDSFTSIYTVLLRDIAETVVLCENFGETIFTREHFFRHSKGSLPVASLLLRYHNLSDDKLALFHDKVTDRGKIIFNMKTFLFTSFLSAVLAATHEDATRSENSEY